MILRSLPEAKPIDMIGGFEGSTRRARCFSRSQPAPTDLHTVGNGVFFRYC